MEKKFSIIIPAYNAEKTIGKCLDSILSRKTDDYEIIIVNDESTDDTQKIAKEYCEKYSSCSMYSQKNAGNAGARNKGLEHAKGKYILFCDSDDKYQVEKFNELLDCADEYLDEFDMLAFDFRDVWQDKTVDEKSHYSEKSIFFDSLNDRIDFVSGEKSHKVCGYAIWDKIYKKKIMDEFDVQTPNRDELKNKDDWADDLIFNVQYFMCCNSIKIIDLPAYLLSKHGMPSEQNENVCLDRFSHMTKYMKFLFTSSALKGCENDFYKLFVWHMKRFIYLDIQNNGIEKTRDSLLAVADNSFVRDMLTTAVHDKKYFTKNFDKMIAEEYFLILEYILNGNLFSYKLKNKILWKIKK